MPQKNPQKGQHTQPKCPAIRRTNDETTATELDNEACGDDEQKQNYATQLG
jgi:hypothetical protein